MHPPQILFPQHCSMTTFASSSFAFAKSLIGTEDIVAGGREIQDININGIGRKQMEQSSLASGSLNSASSRSSASR